MVRAGFTLIEMTIVLVVIGLVIGGVIVGQDIIKAGKIRSTVGQHQAFVSAVGTFEEKYGGLPGDLKATLAEKFEFTTRAGEIGTGDGNGRLLGMENGALKAGCETTLFWRDLSMAGFIDGSFKVADCNYGVGGAATTDIAAVLPEAKLGRGNFWTVFSVGNTNFYELAGITGISATGDYNLTTALSPAEAYNIDKKMDDGAPLTGTVRALADTEALNVPAVETVAVDGGVCVAADGTYIQNDPARANTPACQLRLPFM